MQIVFQAISATGRFRRTGHGASASPLSSTPRRAVRARCCRAHMNTIAMLVFLVIDGHLQDESAPCSRTFNTLPVSARTFWARLAGARSLTSAARFSRRDFCSSLPVVAALLDHQPRARHSEPRGAADRRVSDRLSAHHADRYAASATDDSQHDSVFRAPLHGGHRSDGAGRAGVPVRGLGRFRRTLKPAVFAGKRDGTVLRVESTSST